MSDTIKLEVSEGIATLTLSRPQALNALSLEMIPALHQTVQNLAASAEVQVVVIKGAGEHFMSGGDIKDFHAQLSMRPDARRAMFQELIRRYINPTVIHLRAMHQPVICAVRGACAGFGFSLMLGCDLVIAADNAYFTTAYSLIALSPDGGGTYFLPRVVGARKAAEMLLLAERIDAEQALALGVINRVVPAADLDDQVAALALRLKSGPRHAYGEIKRLVNASYDAELAGQLEAEAAAFGRCSATLDFDAGIRAFVDKRKPSFQGS